MYKVYKVKIEWKFRKQFINTSKNIKPIVGTNNKLIIIMLINKTKNNYVLELNFQSIWFNLFKAFLFSMIYFMLYKFWIDIFKYSILLVIVYNNNYYYTHTYILLYSYTHILIYYYMYINI